MDIYIRKVGLHCRLNKNGEGNDLEVQKDVRNYQVRLTIFVDEIIVINGDVIAL